MKGLMNIGNTCYLNSAIQMILNIEDLCSLIINNAHMSNKLNIIAEFINQYNNPNSNQVINPVKIKELVGNRENMFGGYGQNDSSEFMIFLFDIINEELDKNNAFNCNTIIGIKTAINIKCKLVKCLATSEHFETDMFLYLPITSSLTESYRQYKTNEKLFGDNKYFCEKCNKQTIARKRIETTVWPNNLIIVLKRFDNRLKKNNKEINIPLYWRHNYRLLGGIIHSGDLRGGHYYYFGMRDSRWYVFNDSNISLVQSEDELNSLTKKAYVLNYKK